MSRLATLVGLLALTIAVAERAAYDPRSPSLADRQAAEYELSLSKEPAQMVFSELDERDLAERMSEARRRCSDCTLLGVSPVAARVELSPLLKQRWREQAVRRSMLAGVDPYVQVGDTGRLMRALTRAYTLLLSREGLMSPNPLGVLPALMPADAGSLARRPANSMHWGLPFAVAVAALALALHSKRRAAALRSKDAASAHGSAEERPTRAA